MPYSGVPLFFHSNERPKVPEVLTPENSQCCKRLEEQKVDSVENASVSRVLAAESMRHFRDCRVFIAKCIPYTRVPRVWRTENSL